MKGWKEGQGMNSGRSDKIKDKMNECLYDFEWTK